MGLVGRHPKADLLTININCMYGELLWKKKLQNIYLKFLYSLKQAT